MSCAHDSSRRQAEGPRQTPGPLRLSARRLGSGVALHVLGLDPQGVEDGHLSAEGISFGNVLVLRHAVELPASNAERPTTGSGLESLRLWPDSPSALDCGLFRHDLPFLSTLG